MGRTQYINTN